MKYETIKVHLSQEIPASYIKTRQCSIEGCSKKHYAKDYCSIHYQRLRRYGNPLTTKTCVGNGGNQQEKFWSKIEVGDIANCWEWQGALNEGYGSCQFIINGEKFNRAHRVAYYFANGINPDKFVVCHKCDNPRCCNPSHLFLGTQLDNIKDRTIKGRSFRPIGEKHWNYKGEKKNELR